MGALADCELAVPGLLGQPVNTLTTLAFVAGGAFVARSHATRWVAIALIATGVGSFLFHGPMTAGSEWAHDASLAWLILVIAGLGSRWERWTHLPGLVVIGALFAIAPVAADPIAVGLTLVAVAAIVRHDSSKENMALLGGLAVVAILGRLGSTGGPLCTPGSAWQWHALWHVGAAAVVVLWAIRRERQLADLYPA